MQFCLYRKRAGVSTSGHSSWMSDEQDNYNYKWIGGLFISKSPKNETTPDIYGSPIISTEESTCTCKWL